MSRWIRGGGGLGREKEERGEVGGPRRRGNVANRTMERGAPHVPARHSTGSVSTPSPSPIRHVRNTTVSTSSPSPPPSTPPPANSTVCFRGGSLPAPPFLRGHRSRTPAPIGRSLLSPRFPVRVTYPFLHLPMGKGRALVIFPLS
eukprot:scaffold308_cov327-Pavlova_lutheri.AAC.6